MLRSLFRFFLPCAFLLFYNSSVQAQFFKNILKGKDTDETHTLLLPDAQLESIEKNLKEDIKFLSSSKTQNREAGSIGEKSAGIYIQSRMSQDLLLPYKKTFRHSFRYVSGRSLTGETRLQIAGKFVFIPEEAFPTSFSSEGSVEDFILKDVNEPYGSWLLPLYANANEANIPGLDWETSVYKRAKLAQSRSAKAVFFYDAYGTEFSPEYSNVIEGIPLKIPVVIIKKKAYDQHIANANTIKSFNLNIRYKNDLKEGNNVIGIIDNKAAKTVVIAAHYDNLLKNQLVHPNNLDSDEVTGIATLLSLAKVLKNSNLNKYNYIIAAFSGNEHGLAGSLSLIQDLGQDTNKIAYMINLDRVGRLNANKLYVGGLGSSPFWNGLFKTVNSSFQKTLENNLLVESDHLSFFEKKIPVLYFTTDMDRKEAKIYPPVDYKGLKEIVNYLYGIIGFLNTQASPIFYYNNPIAGVVLDSPAEWMEFLGITTDPHYQGIGVMVQNIRESSPALKSDLHKGDIIFQINDERFDDRNGLIEVLKNLDKKEQSKIKIKRGVTVQTLDISF